MDIKIYTLTHKKFNVPPDPLYVPLQVGSEEKEDLGYLCDNTGENISALNCYYSELTGLYWIWKNDHETEYVGTCHYRRFLLNEQEKIFTKRELEEKLRSYDLITTKRVHLNNSYYYGFSANHNIHALDVTGEVIKEKYPAYYDTFVRLVNGPETYFGNMFVTSKKHFDDYCSWLFTIFFEVQKRIDLETDADEYHRRVFGFISEFLLLVWITVNQLHVFECKVGMIGEKAETREMKEQIAVYLEKRDVAGAKKYFMDYLRKRPDVLMEASDITGELRLCMQIIGTADRELQLTGHSFLERVCSLPVLIKEFSGLNQIVGRCRLGQESEEDAAFIKEYGISRIAAEVAVCILPMDEKEKNTLLQKIMEHYFT